MASTKDLPEGIITQILYNVPAKCIGRFRSVSKGWLSLLTHPDFIKFHDRNSLNKHHLIFFPNYSINMINCSAVLYSNSYDKPMLRFTDFGIDRKIRRYNHVPHVMKICGSCNGLVLVRAAINIDYYTLVLLNPTTRESMILPKCPDKSYMNYYRYCEPGYKHGLGYDSETGDFKVVSLTCLYDSFYKMHCVSIFVDVYSLKTDTWSRRLTDFLVDYGHISPNNENSVFVDGFLHWVTRKPYGKLVILAFSLADEKFNEVPSPEFVQSTEYLSSDYCQLVVLGGKLAFFHEIKGEIWLMNEYRIKESWTKISLHGIHGIPMVTPYRYETYKPMVFCNGGKFMVDGDDKPMVFHHDGKFMVANSDRMMIYDDEKETFEETVCVWDRKRFNVAGSYVESLVSIDSCIEQ